MHSCLHRMADAAFQIAPRPSTDHHCFKTNEAIIITLFNTKCEVKGASTNVYIMEQNLQNIQSLDSELKKYSIFL